MITELRSFIMKNNLQNLIANTIMVILLTMLIVSFYLATKTRRNRKAKTYKMGEKMCKVNPQGFGVEFTCQRDKCKPNDPSAFSRGLLPDEGGNC